MRFSDKNGKLHVVSGTTSRAWYSDGRELTDSEMHQLRLNETERATKTSFRKTVTIYDPVDSAELFDVYCEAEDDGEIHWVEGRGPYLHTWEITGVVPTWISEQVRTSIVGDLPKFSREDELVEAIDMILAETHGLNGQPDWNVVRMIAERTLKGKK